LPKKKRKKRQEKLKAREQERVANNNRKSFNTQTMVRGPGETSNKQKPREKGRAKGGVRPKPDILEPSIGDGWGSQGGEVQKGGKTSPGILGGVFCFFFGGAVSSRTRLESQMRQKKKGKGKGEEN